MTGFRYAGFWIRTIATLIDWVILNLATWIIDLALLGAFYWIGKWTGVGPAASGASFHDLYNGFAMQIVDLLVYGSLSAPYYILGHHRYQTTLGKKVFKLYVVRADNGMPLTLQQSVLRWVMYVVSYLPLGTGFLMAALHPEKRALHDLLAGTICVREIGAQSGK